MVMSAEGGKGSYRFLSSVYTSLCRNCLGFTILRLVLAQLIDIPFSLCCKFKQNIHVCFLD